MDSNTLQPQAAPKVNPRAHSASFLLTLAVGVAFALCGLRPVAAAPTGENVVAGSAAVTRPDALTTQINQSTAQAIINWKGFSIDVNELVKFLQPDAAAVALNRVTGVDPSTILGQLLANGRVFLVNPNGVLFGPNSKVDVGSLIASTFDIQDSDFLAGKYDFLQKAGKGSSFVINKGEIRVAKNGFVFLVAPGVKNEGLIIANVGKVVLGSGTKLSVDFNGDGLLTYSVDGKVLDSITGPDGKALKDSVSNTGTIKNPGGTVVLSGNAAKAVAQSVVNQEGVIEAQSLVKRGGKVLLEARGEGEVKQSGTIDVSSAAVGATGGEVTITGESVNVSGDVDASGDAGGGTIQVGGGLAGADPTVPNATDTTVTETATLTADAVTSGDGGTVVVWADKTTVFDGAISATGGAEAGDGGFAEVSGKETLTITGHADLTAANGNAGTLLLDPGQATIENSVGQTGPNVFSDDYIQTQLGLSNFAVVATDTGGGT